MVCGDTWGRQQDTWRYVGIRGDTRKQSVQGIRGGILVVILGHFWSFLVVFGHFWSSRKSSLGYVEATHHTPALLTPPKEAHAKFLLRRPSGQGDHPPPLPATLNLTLRLPLTLTNCYVCARLEKLFSVKQVVRLREGIFLCPCEKKTGLSFPNCIGLARPHTPMSSFFATPVLIELRPRSMEFTGW